MGEPRNGTGSALGGRATGLRHGARRGGMPNLLGAPTWDRLPACHAARPRLPVRGCADIGGVNVCAVCMGMVGSVGARKGDWWRTEFGLRLPQARMPKPRWRVLEMGEVPKGTESALEVRATELPHDAHRCVARGRRADRTAGICLGGYSGRVSFSIQRHSRARKVTANSPVGSAPTTIYRAARHIFGVNR